MRTNQLPGWSKGVCCPQPVKFVQVRGGVKKKCGPICIQGFDNLLALTPCGSPDATQVLLDGFVSIPYSNQLTASGGTSPYTFLNTYPTFPTLPTGLTISSSGLISGTPSIFGTFTFTIQVTDAKGCISTQVFQIQISNP